jgi:hypothetical protein
MTSKYADYLKALNAGEINAETFAELTINLDKDSQKFSGGCLNCSYETTDRAELKAHNCTEIYLDPALNCECGYQH